MTENTIQVMIIEDDVIAAKIYEQFAHKLTDFRIVATASNGQQALELLEVFMPDLILLDVFLPDISGIEIMWTIRHMHRNIDVILITAANDTETVSEAIRGGAFGYIIKPILIDKFSATLEQYATKRNQLHHQQIMDQHEVDQFFRPSERSMGNNQISTEGNVLPKGIDKLTLRLVRDKIKATRDPVSADELAEIAGMSHSTVRRYLEYMVSIHEVNVDIIYGTVGRPERKYRWFRNIY
jgi:response regulator of citrate/malate metabolism